MNSSSSVTAQRLHAITRERMKTTMKWAFMTANFVAREMDYKMNSLAQWGDAHEATVEAFHGKEFEVKFEEIVQNVKECGYDAMELWVAHLDPLRSTPEMVDSALNILHRYDMEVPSYTAGFGKPGATRADAVKIFETAKQLGASCLAQGFHPDNGPLVKEMASLYGIKMGLENHPEKTPKEAMDKVKDFYPWVGIAYDTGWIATQGYDPVQAVVDFKDYLVHVHLKDVLAVGEHDTCALGDGIVDIKGVLRKLKEIGYSGYITIEHEPLQFDPSNDMKASLERAKSWWAKIDSE